MFLCGRRGRDGKLVTSKSKTISERQMTMCSNAWAASRAQSGVSLDQIIRI